jgi:hypothetical protein
LPVDLTNDEKAAVIEALRDPIDRDRFPLSLRIELLRSILGRPRPVFLTDTKSPG